MPLSTLALRRTSIAIVVLLLAMGAAWWGLWSVAAAQYRSVIDHWIEVGRASGYHIEYGDREMFGFPHHVTLRFKNIHWVDTEGINFHADQMDLSSTPWRWQIFNAAFKGHVELSAPLDTDGRALTLGGDQGRAHVELDDSGIWKFSRVELDRGRFGRAPDFLIVADRLEASATRPDQPPRDHTQPGLNLQGKAKNLTLPDSMPTPFGQKMAALDATLRVMGEVPDFRHKDSVAAWNSIMGVVEFDRLHMEWGPLEMTAKGTIGFDDDLQPEGAFSGAINHHEDVLKALMDHDYIAKRQAGMLSSALSLFAKPSADAPGIDVPITIQLGGLFLGPVKVFTFPAIEWPKAEVGIPAPVLAPAAAAPTQAPATETAQPSAPATLPSAPSN